MSIPKPLTKLPGTIYNCTLAPFGNYVLSPIGRFCYNHSPTKFQSFCDAIGEVTHAASIVSNIDKEEDALVFKLRKALDDLKLNIDKSLPTVHTHANKTHLALKAILDLTDAEQEKVLGSPSNFAAVINPLKELNLVLLNFVNPTLRNPQPSIEEIKRRIPPADRALDQQLAKIQGILAKVISFSSSRGTREVEHAFQKLGGNGDVPQPLSFRHHPLHELRHLIGCFMNNADYIVLDDREDQLKRTLEHLGCYSKMFGAVTEDERDFASIKEYISTKLGAKALHSGSKESLETLKNQISSYLRLRIAKFTPRKDEDFFLLLYESARRSRHLRVRRIEGKAEQIRWSQMHLAQDLMNQDEDIIWEAFIQYDEILLMKHYFDRIMEHRECTSIKELADNVDRVLLYFQHIPPSEAKEEVLLQLSHTLIAWVSFSKGWIHTNKSGNNTASLEVLDRINEAVIQKKYDEAIRLLKREIEHGPMSQELAANGGVVSPLKDLQAVKTKFDEDLRALQVAPEINFEEELESSRNGLAEMMSYYATYNLVMTYICRIPENQSKEIYNRLIEQVQEKPTEKTRTFFKLLAGEISQLEEVSIFAKWLAKFLMFLLYAPIRLFANRTTKSGLHFIQHYIQLPSKEPLGKIHISPFEKLTRCFNANLAAMKSWADDVTCEKYGSTTRDEGLKKILKNPKLNANFEQEELLMKSGLLAVDLFVNISHIHEIPVMLRQNINANVNAPFFALHEDHFLNKMAHIFKSAIMAFPHMAVEIFYYICLILDYFINLLVQWGAKKVLVSYDLPNRLFKSLSHNVYNRQYIPVFDEMILKQFRLIENAIDEESSGSLQAEKESSTTRETIKEMIKNLLELVELRHNLTKEEIRNPRKDDIPFVDEHTREVIRGLLNDNLSETLVNLLITLIQSLFNEERMNDFLLNFIRAITASLTTQASILTEEDREQLRADHGGLSDQIIKDGIKNKCYKQELAIRETLQRIIDKSVHRVVDQVVTEKATNRRAPVEYLAWMERTFYGPERTNFVSGMRQKIETFKTTPGKREALLIEIQRDFRAFMNELERKHLALDEEPIAQTRRMQYFANKVLLPNLQKLSGTLRELMRDNTAYDACERALNDFSRDLLSQKIYFHSMQAVEQEKSRQESQGVIGKVRAVLQTIGEKSGPVVAVKVEDALTKQIGTFATGVLSLPKNSAVIESVLNQVVLVPLLEGNGVKPDLRYSD
ncbi:hypothetical protein [Simkania sp.]|uniref:hypothetical protein n=1 Tax=Simkania sp. TaxID=34094 RepID=UPI003B52254D